jgi:endonuclease/exonuclease/phosphatase (EEP) superfamily protein YafD
VSRVPGRVLDVALVLGAAVVALWVPFWWWGPADSPAAFALLSVTPWVAVLAAVVAALALLRRRWTTGVVALVAAVVLGAIVVPRALEDGDPIVTAGPGSAPVVVATVNLQFGRADPAAVVALARDRRVDVLGLQEITPDAEQRLAAAGLRVELPFTESAARRGAGGTALVSRYPLAPSGLTLRPGTFSQVTARVLAPAGPVDVVVAHPSAPVFRDDADGWAREIAQLPGPAPSAGPPRLVIGDFNATLDHRPLRALLVPGTWRDAASAVGGGLRGTWPTDSALPPFAAIDHVLVSGPVTPVDVEIQRLPSTDHAGLVATLLVRSGTGPLTPGA